MLIIRFARRGRTGQAFFDLVVAEKARPVKKKFINKLGYFNPRTNEGAGEFVFDKERVEKYINNGAQVSQSAARLLAKNGCELAGKFIEQRASKPKKTEPPKEEAVEEPTAEKAAADETPAEEKAKEAATNEAPAEEKSEELDPEEATVEAPAEEKAEEPDAKTQETPAQDDKKDA